MPQRIIHISYLRALATLMIFICHVLFISGAFELSMWFNTGVPLFFIISAFLMSRKTFGDKFYDFGFYLKRAKAIMLPYELYIFAIIAVSIVIGQTPTVKGITMYALGLAGFSDTSLLGLGHLWFISILLICYVITPALYSLITHYKISATAYYLMVCGVSLTFIALGAAFHGMYASYAVHLATYIVLYRYFINTSDVTTYRKLWLVIAITCSLIRIFFDRYFMNCDYEAYYYYDSLFQPFVRLSIALAVFMYSCKYAKQIEN